MNDFTPSEPIQVTENALPGQLMAFVRDGLVGVTAWAVGKGYIDQVTGTQFVSVGLIVATMVWRQYVTYRTHSKLVTAAAAAPNSVATIR